MKQHNQAEDTAPSGVRHEDECFVYVPRDREREELLNINYVAHRFGFRLPFCIINCIRDKRRVIASEIINSETRSFPALIAICTTHSTLRVCSSYIIQLQFFYLSWANTLRLRSMALSRCTISIGIQL